jgi:dihydroflavonol-4-reductase
VAGAGRERPRSVKALVLGATGFIGGGIARALTERGAFVRALRRGGSLTAAIDGLPIEFVDGDLRDAESLERAMRGCDVVFHAAAPFPKSARHPDAQVASALRTTDDFLGAASNAGVPRLIYISSYTTIGRPSETRCPADESCRYVPSRHDPLYFRMKAAMEERILDSGAPVVVLNPTMCIGPGDVKPTTGRFVLLYAKTRFPFHLPGGVDVVDVRCAARAAVEAAERGMTGDRYILSGSWMTLAAFAGAAARAAGVRAGGLPIPFSVLRAAARAAEAVWRILPGGSPGPLADAIEMLRLSIPVSSAKARRELSLEPTDPDRAVADAVAWFGAHGYI